MTPAPTNITTRLATVQATRLASAPHGLGALARHVRANVHVAVLVAGEVRWDWPLYVRLSEVIKGVAAEQCVPITWGGDWRGFRDGPHYELPWERYPVG